MVKCRNGFYMFGGFFVSLFGFGVREVYKNGDIFNHVIFAQY